MPNWTLQAVLDELHGSTGASFRPGTFEDRLRIQKAVYLLRGLGLPAASAYEFNDYFHGPYSPALAREYYELQAVGDVSRPTRADRREIPEAVLRVGRGICPLRSLHRFRFGSSAFLAFRAASIASHVSSGRSTRSLNCPAPRSHCPPSITTHSPLTYSDS